MTGPVQIGQRLVLTPRTRGFNAPEGWVATVTQYPPNYVHASLATRERFVAVAWNHPQQRDGNYKLEDFEPEGFVEWELSDVDQ